MLKQRSGANIPSQELQLLEFVQRLTKFRDGRRAIHIHLSRLLPHNRRPAQLRIALNTFEFLVKPFDGQIFALGSGDIVFVWNGSEIVAIDEAASRLRHLFRHDPATQGEDEEISGQFCDWYDLGRQFEDFLATVQGLRAEQQKRAHRIDAIAGPAEPEAVALPPLNPHRLGELVDAIASADLSNMMRRQPVCAIASGSPPVPMFRELYMSIDELREIVMPGHDITSDRWLFQHLTQTLDQKMLQLLSKTDDGTLAGSFSVNLNVSTILSDRFIAYDAGLRSAARGTIIFELQTLDIFADLGAFIFARDFVKERGYRICLDGVTDRMLPFIDREQLGIDLVKVVWNEELERAGMAQRERLRDLVGRIGVSRTILCHCDSPKAVSTGRALGINLFQGRHIDALLGDGSRELNSLQKLRAAVQSGASRR